jgi:lipopolysaccharide biosynthesis protein
VTGEASNTSPSGVRCAAFYLPQFHPIPENDEWWGEGFTEWRKVRAARPRFPAHQQPRLPGELGFYDLREPEVRAAQATLARAHGIDAFCYYHYWFNGRRLLEQPFTSVLESGEPDLPFLLCWANENWTRAWDGGEAQVLMAQDYSEQDDRMHVRALAEAFSDPRYVTVDGRPVFLFYRAGLLPDARRTVDTWRDEAARIGLPDLYLCRVESFPEERVDPSDSGFDAAVEFQPAWKTLRTRSLPRAQRVLHRLGVPGARPPRFTRHSYRELVEERLSAAEPPYLRFPCVTPGFDNTPRRDVGAIVLTGSTPELYGDWLRGTLQRFVHRTPQENLVFVNAWNEWGEGNVLEPDLTHGRAYLEAHLSARRSVNR